MNEEFLHRYRTQMCWDQWFDVDGAGDAEEVRLWDDDTYLASTLYVPVPGEPNSRGTYMIGDHNLGHGRELTDDERFNWRYWRDALEFASDTDREEWDKD